MAMKSFAPSFDERVSTVKANGELRKAFTISKAEAIDNTRQIKFTITTDDVDRDNDVIAVDGWNFANYLKNPVVLWAHDHYGPPIGRSVSLTSSGNKVEAIIEFADATLYPFADMIFRMIKAGYINAGSVGFRATRYAINEERRGIDFLEQELLEFSICPVPANQNALVAASATGIDLEPLRNWVQNVIEAWPGELKMRGKAWRKLMSEPDPEPVVERKTKIGELETTLRVDTAAIDVAAAKAKALDEMVDRLLEKFAKLKTNTDAVSLIEPISATIEETVDDAKSGRVLSRANIARLAKAMEHCSKSAEHSGNCSAAIKETLDSVRRDDEDPDEPEEESRSLETSDDPTIELVDAEPVEELGLELADDKADDGLLDVDEDMLMTTIRNAVVGTMSELAREAAVRAMNQARGRID